MKYLVESPFLHRVVLLIDFQVGIMDSDNLVIDMLTEMN